MRVFEIKLSNLNESSSSTATTLILPATWAELNDALQKARIPDDRVIYAMKILDSEPENLMQIIPKHANLYELNHLAERLDKLQDWQMDAFEGLTMMDVVRTSYAPIPVERLINMTHSLVECQVVFEAFDDDSLGRFYVNNDFFPELETLSEKVFPWLDYSKIGKEMREAEKGVFIPGAYVVHQAEMSKEYSFDTAAFSQRPDYAFLLEIAVAPKNDHPNDENCATLKLPATIDDIENALNQLDCKSLSDCVFYRFETFIPALSTIFWSMDDFKDLNDLAQEIQTIDAHGELPKFKALLQAAEWYDIVPATELARDLDAYNFDPEMVMPREYAESVLEKLDIPLQRKFFDMAVLDAYGEELMEHNNIHSTDYGLISRKDGEPIMVQEQDSPTMTMQ